MLLKREVPCFLVQQAISCSNSVLGHLIECSVPSSEVVQVPDEVLSLLEASAAAERLHFDSFFNSMNCDGTRSLHSDDTTTEQPTHYQMRPRPQGRRTLYWAAVAPCLTNKKLGQIPKLPRIGSMASFNIAASLTADEGTKQSNLTGSTMGIEKRLCDKTPLTPASYFRSPYFIPGRY